MRESWLGYTGIRQDKRLVGTSFFFNIFFPRAGESQQRGLGFGSERIGAARQTEESGAASRTKRGKGWRYSEKISRERHEECHGLCTDTYWKDGLW